MRVGIVALAATAAAVLGGAAYWFNQQQIVEEPQGPVSAPYDAAASSQTPPSPPPIPGPDAVSYDTHSEAAKPPQGAKTSPPKLLFLAGSQDEPEAYYYTYLAISEAATDAQKNALAKGVSCELPTSDVLGAFGDVNALGLITLPALSAGAQQGETQDALAPSAVLEAYDHRRADKWIASVVSAGELPQKPTALLIVSPFSRGDALDGASLEFSTLENYLGPGEDLLDPLVVDVSALPAEHLQHWMHVFAIKTQEGEISSPYSLQEAFTSHSWARIEESGSIFTAHATDDPLPTAPECGF